MLRWFLVGLVLCSLCAGLPLVADDKSLADKKPADAKSNDGWKVLFDGKSLDGWKANERPENWKLEDGVLVGRGDRSHLFYVAEEFKDFEFEAEVKTQKGTNSGIYFHTKFQRSGWPEYGHEAQVNNSHTDPVRTGSLYNVKKVYKSEAKDDEWFTESIKVVGRHITIKVNGKTVVDYEEPADVKGNRKVSQGLFALQQHDPGSVVRYRLIRVKKL